MDMVSGEEGDDRMYGDSNTETYITICKTESQWEFDVWLSELKLWLWNNLEGWDGKGSGKGVQEGDTGIPMTDSCWVWQKPTQYYKAIILQLKIYEFNLKKLTFKKLRE